jgi:hypothetical protein
MTSNGGRLTPDVTRVSLPETRAACCRNRNAQLGGHPWLRLAHSFSAWRSTRRRWPWRMSPTITAPRSPPWAPWGHDSVTSIHASVSGHRKPHPSALSLRLAPGAPGSLGLERTKTPPAGWWRPHACPQRLVIGSKRTAGPLCHWLASRAPESSRRSLSPRATRTPCATSPGRVQMPSVLSKPPPAVSKPVCSDTLAAPPAGPMGARPPGGGSLQLAVPRPRHQALCQHTSERCMSRPPASNGSSPHATSPCTPGVCPRCSRRCRPGVACHARWPSPAGRHGVP